MHNTIYGLKLDIKGKIDFDRPIMVLDPDIQNDNKG